MAAPLPKKLTDLPAELHKEIFSFLNATDLTHMTAVSRYFHEAASDFPL